MRPLGVGLVYFSELDPLFQEGNPDLAVLELEPETFWEKIQPPNAARSEFYLPNAEVMTHIRALPQHKLIHSVGFPVGGSVCGGGDFITPLRESVTALGAAWVSEHLSFNAISTSNGVEQVGFLLPPRQTSAGVLVAVRNIQRLASQLPVPFAFETGTNYLQPLADELPDGEFFGAIAERANSGVLLDLHNLWVNERNGRQPVVQVIDALPLDRIWEMHFAGGMMLGDYYLDSHSGAIPSLLLDIAAEIVPRLPNLGALIFEVLPGYVEQLGLNSVRQQLKLLNELWKTRPTEMVHVSRRQAALADSSDGRIDVVEWERILGTIAVGHSPSEADVRHLYLNGDAGVRILQTLIGEARNSRISRALRFTTTLLLLHLGSVETNRLLCAYHAASFPDAFATAEADRFAEYLHTHISLLPSIPFLTEVLEFEHALIRAALYGAKSRIEWDIDPSDLFGALEKGRIPSPKRTNRFAMEIVPEN